MGTIVLAQILIIQYGGVVFGTVPLSLNQWITIVVASASVLVIGFLLRTMYGSVHAGKKSQPG
jgi:Ca2+-transporting ATPase